MFASDSGGSEPEIVCSCHNGSQNSSAQISDAPHDPRYPHSKSYGAFSQNVRAKSSPDNVVSSHYSRYKDYNTPARIAALKDTNLIALGIDSKEDRKAIMRAMRESGYVPKDVRNTRLSVEEGSSSGVAGTSAQSNFAESVVRA